MQAASALTAVCGGHHMTPLHENSNMNELRRRLHTIMGEEKEALSDQSPTKEQVASRHIALLGNAIKFRCTCNTAIWLLFRPTTNLVASVLCLSLSPPSSAVVLQRLLIEENLGRLVRDFSPSPTRHHGEPRYIVVRAHRTHSAFVPAAAADGSQRHPFPTVV